MESCAFKQGWECFKPNMSTKDIADANPYPNTKKSIKYRNQWFKGFYAKNEEHGKQNGIYPYDDRG